MCGGTTDESAAVRDERPPVRPSPAGRLTVRDVLDLELMARWAPEVVAGAAYLDRPIRWVHVAEVTDISVMLNGGEMVVTTGSLLVGDDQAQVDYVEAMRRADVAAIVLGLGRAFRTTPEPMQRAAERCGVPLIVLHRPAPFVRLTEEVHSRLVYGRFAALNLSDGIRSSLTALNLSGATLQQLLDEIAAYSGCPVVLVNLAYRVLASAGDKASLSELLRDWDRVSREVAALACSEPVRVGPDGWIVVTLEARGQRWGRLVLFGYPGSDEFGAVLGLRAAEALATHRLLGDRDQDWEEQAAESLLLDLASGTARPDQLFTRARAAGLPVNRRTFVPVVFRLLGEVRAVRTGTAAPGSADARRRPDAGAARRVSGKTGAPRQPGSVDARRGTGPGPARAGEPGHAGTAGRPGPPDRSERTADPATPSARTGDRGRAGEPERAADCGRDGLYEAIDRAVAELPAVAGLVARIGPAGTAVLLSIPHGEDPDAAVHRVAVRVRDALAARGRTAVGGAGFACSDLDDVRRSFVEAVHVADAAVAAPPDGPVARLRDVRLRGLVRLLRDDPELQAFIERELGPLLANPPLLEVLRTYMATGRNKSLAAQALHVSRPTLYRRLERIEALLGIDLEDWERLTSLYVALLAHEAQRAAGP